MIKSEITQSKEKNEWPKLMESIDGDFVLILNYDESGMVIGSSTSAFKVGAYIKRWNREVLRPFTGKITLENE